MTKTIILPSPWVAGQTVRVSVVQRANARRFVMRRKHKGEYSLTIPCGQSLDRVHDVAANLLAQFHPEVSLPLKFRCGSLIKCFEHTIGIVVERNSNNRRGIRVVETPLYITVYVNDQIDITTEQAQYAINTVLKKVAFVLAQRHLISEGRDVARPLGVSVGGWRIGRGTMTLGTCSSKKIITLSAMLGFLPLHLRRYVVMHELTHLTYMNHSTEFYDLLDRFAGGRLQLLRQELKAFDWPILR